MDLKEQVLKFVNEFGTEGRSYVDIYNIFKPGDTRSNKSKSDYIRGILRRNKTKKAVDKEVCYEDFTTSYQPIIPSKEEGLYLVLGCCHAPMVNLPFWKAMLKLASDRKNDIKGLVLAGDFLDLHSLSAYDRGKIAIKGLTLSEEYKGANIYLNSVLDALNPNIYKGWLNGNHEHRSAKYMSDVDNSKLGSALISPIEALKLVDKGFEIFTNWKDDEIVLGNDLSIIHGEICSVNPCKKYIDVFKRNFLFFHTHRTSMFRDGEHVAYNAGSMADFTNPVFSYATKAMKKTWTNSFAVVTLHKGITQVDIPVWNGEFFTYGGKIYK